MYSHGINICKICRLILIWYSLHWIHYLYSCVLSALKLLKPNCHSDWTNDINALFIFNYFLYLLDTFESIIQNKSVRPWQNYASIFFGKRYDRNFDNKTSKIKIIPIKKKETRRKIETYPPVEASAPEDNLLSCNCSSLCTTTLVNQGVGVSDTIPEYSRQNKSKWNQ